MFSRERIVTVVGNRRFESDAKNSFAGRKPPTGTAFQPVRAPSRLLNSLGCRWCDIDVSFGQHCNSSLWTIKKAREDSRAAKKRELDALSAHTPPRARVEGPVVIALQAEEALGRHDSTFVKRREDVNRNFVRNSIIS
jgi:hypothetical protein